MSNSANLPRCGGAQAAPSLAWAHTQAFTQVAFKNIAPNRKRENKGAIACRTLIFQHQYLQWTLDASICISFFSEIILSDT